MHYLHYFINVELPHTVSFFTSNFCDLKNVLRLCRYPQDAVSTVVAEVVRKAQERNLKADIIHNSIDNNVCGIIIPEASIGIYSEMIKGENFAEYKKAGSEAFAQAKKIHDKMEEIYIKNTDFARLEDFTNVAAQMFFSVQKSTKNKFSGKEIHRFFGATTINGAVNYIPQITADLKNRYFIKGRPGTGKSTFLKKLAAAGIKSGYDVEIYHCSLDPKSLDMIIVRELSLCVFDSTAPHEFFPERNGDGIIDIYEMCVNPETDEKYSAELTELQREFSRKLAEGREYIKKINDSSLDMEKKIPPVSKAEIDKLAEEMGNCI